MVWKPLHAQVFITRADQLLSQECQLQDTFRIGSISVGSQMCADDTCFLTTNHIGAQTSIYLAQDDAIHERYEFSATKTKIMLCNPQLTVSDATSSMPIELNHQITEYTEKEKHRGIEERQMALQKRCDKGYKAVGE